MNHTSARPQIGITGSTGALGGMVAQHLADAGVHQRLLVRRLDRAPRHPNAEAVAFSYTNNAQTVAALDGIDLLFMVSAGEDATRIEQHRSFIDAAVLAGVSHIVYTSFLHAGDDAVFTLARDHGATEKYLIESGLNHTFLRDSFYLDFVTELAGDDGAIRGPAGTGRGAYVAREDVARVAAVVLQHPNDHLNVTYNLTGPEEVSFDDIARAVSEIRGTPVHYVAETLEEARASRAGYNAPDWQLDAWISTYTAIAAGETGPVSPDVENITGRRPLSLRELLLRTTSR